MSATSYAEEMSVGPASDPETLPALDRLAREIEAATAELLTALGPRS